MSRRTILIILSAAVAALVIAGTVVWMNAESYDETVSKCQKALAAQMKAGGEGKPDACKDVKEDDYSAVLMNQIMDNEGWLDENGDFDKNKWLEDTLNDQP